MSEIGNSASRTTRDCAPQSETSVAVGILHSFSGTMAISEPFLRDAALMAIAEINENGGVLGQRIEPILADGASNPTIFANQAKQLLRDRAVIALFGCWTSASRKALLPILEQANVLLWYPLQYEGLEGSSNIFYTGSCPNQQIEPAVRWLLTHQRKRLYLLGSDYVFPRTVNKIIQAQLRREGGECLAEQYVPLGTDRFESILAFIRQVRPDAIISTLNGDSNIAFYQQYKAAGLKPQNIPILAMSVAEEELSRIGSAAVGHYASWGYFQSLDNERNRVFVRNFKARYGQDRVTSDPIESAYTQVYLWKQAVEKAQSFETNEVRRAAYDLTFDSPGGSVRIDANHHLWKYCRIGQILPTGQFQAIDETQDAIAPKPWLGLEDWDNPLQPTIVDLLAEVSEGIHHRCQLEENSRALKVLMVQLIRANQQLRSTQRQLTAAEQRYQQLQAKEQLLKKRLSSQIRNSLELETILAIAVEEIFSFLAIDCCQFLWYFPSRESNVLEIAACQALPPDRCRINSHAALQAIVQTLGDRLLAIDDFSLDSQLAPSSRESLQSVGLASLAVAPVRPRSGQMGFILCAQYDTPKTWNNRELKLLQAVVDQLEIAIDQAKLYEQSKTAAQVARSQAHQLGQALYDLQQTQAQLIQTEKMSALGMLVAGVAHEIKNPVGFICGNLNYAQEYARDLIELVQRYQKHYPNPPEEIQDFAESVELDFLIEDFPKTLSSMDVGAQRIQNLVLSLRNFSRRDSTQMEKVDLHEGIESTLLILSHRLKGVGARSEIEVIKNYGELPLVECYPSQINQVFMNLLGNAVDVLEEMDRPGQIAINTTTSERNSQPTVTIRIRDNGNGISPEVQEQLFEPFFTTKPIGKGTGLGLAISQQIIVEKHGGHLACQSVVGEGTEFSIELAVNP
ncbi:urea ABC transporter substrate-binding protein [Lusitaniella coriacea]|uniref:urea ABC transporter substrate-binding protein n=1 Tax=Lusitaniella coriacea TaxID=1983105 RepID=UPI003CF3E7B9